MTIMRRHGLGFGFMVASSLLAMNAACALNGPASITIDGGPLGALQLSGAAEGYGYVIGNNNKSAVSTGITPNNDGINFGAGMVELQKATGLLQFTVELSSMGGAIVLGSNTPGQSTFNQFSTGPLYAGYVTFAPKAAPVTISAGRFASLEGYESSFAWGNATQFTTVIADVGNNASNGVQVAYTQGPLAASLLFGDGWDTHVFNFMQALVTYTFNSDNVLNAFYGGNLGRTGVNAHIYGNTGTSWKNTSVASYGPYFVNSQTFGMYYSYTGGALSVTPEMQYVYAKPDARVGVNKFSANLATAVFGEYSFPNTPYSLGGWVEYEDSVGASNWFNGGHSQGVGLALSPTWQHKDLYVRLNGGMFYLTHRTAGNGFGDNANKRTQLMGTLDIGLEF